ncbi:MAG: hypothetical protein U0797_05365 [Gemmataceae bacterium]
MRLLNQGDLDREREPVGPDVPAALRLATGYHDRLPAGAGAGGWRGG